jgi:hypothetical protein
MGSKYGRQVTPAPPAHDRRTRQVLAGLLLLVVGASVALSAQWLIANASGPKADGTPGPSASPAVASSPLASAAAAASASPSAASSASPSASPIAAAPLLEAQMPRAVNGTTLTTQSTTGATSLGRDPGSRALNAAVTSLGRKASDLEIAEAYDASGSLALTILGFRVAGLDPTKLRSVLLDAWLSVKTPGVTSSNVSLSGTPATKVSYPDGGPNEYVFVHGDSAFVVISPADSAAANAVAAMATVMPSPSGG